MQLSVLGHHDGSGLLSDLTVSIFDGRECLFFAQVIDLGTGPKLVIANDHPLPNHDDSPLWFERAVYYAVYHFSQLAAGLTVETVKQVCKEWGDVVGQPVWFFHDAYNEAVCVGLERVQS